VALSFQSHGLTVLYQQPRLRIGGTFVFLTFDATLSPFTFGLAGVANVFRGPPGKRSLASSCTTTGPFSRGFTHG
jgi:hypothetical protein